MALGVLFLVLGVASYIGALLSMARVWAREPYPDTDAIGHRETRPWLTGALALGFGGCCILTPNVFAAALATGCLVAIAVVVGNYIDGRLRKRYCGTFSP